MAKKAKTGAGLSGGGLTELKRRLLFLIIGLLVYRLGCYVPVPGIDAQSLFKLFSSHNGGILSMFNMFSGGALSRMTIFALGVMPYISASIIIQMFGSVLPKFQQLKKEGEAGQRTMNQYTRYLTLALGVVQSFGIAKWLAVQHNIVYDPNFSFYFTAVVTLVTGTMFLMWLGEQMTEHGIGNGISLLIFASIASRFPSAVHQVIQQVHEGQMSGIGSLLLFALVVGVILVIVFFERAQRQIKIQYAKRQQGRKMYAAQSSTLPLKLNMSGVIPPIFAQSIIMFPTAIAAFFAHGSHAAWLNYFTLIFGPGQPAYMITMVVLVILFSFFYTALTFNPKETADNLKKSGAFIPGIRPGEQTAKYIDKVMTRLTLVGSIYLALVSLLPQFFVLAWNVSFYFGGTSLLIMVVVIMDLMAQVQAYLMSYQYESVMKKTRRGGGSSIGFM